MAARAKASVPKTLLRKQCTSTPLRWHPFMSLSRPQIQVIVDATAELAGPDAQVRLFGSRLDDALHGGDIDLLVECPNKVARPV